VKTIFCHLALAANLTLLAFAESNTTNILDGVTTNAAGSYTLGDTGPLNFLLITNAGALTNTTGTVGNTADAHGNLAIITGVGSVWASAPSLTIGVRGASNQVSVLDGAKLASSVAIGIGTYDTSVGNRLLVSGADSSLSADRLFLGTYSSHNELIAEQGARVELNQLTINSEQSSIGRNRAIFRNAGTIVSNASLFIGGSPSNLVTIGDGAHFRGNSINLGASFRGNANQLDLSGAGTIVTLRNGLTAGQSGSNNLATLRDSATLLAERIDIGAQSSGNQLLLSSGSRVVNTRIPNANASLVLGSAAGADDNLLLLQNPGTIWSNSGYIFIGSSGSRNAIILSNGALFSDSHAGIGGIIIGDNSVSSSNLLRLTGSTLTSRHGLVLGRSGSQNLLLQSDGSRLVTSSADIGQSCIARDNLAFITGAGTVWSNDQLQVGFCSTNNHLIVSNGAQLFAGLVRSSVQGGASNTMTVTGPGSLLRAAGDLIVGNSGGANSLRIADSGRVEGRNDRVGLAGSNNGAFVSGPGTSWSNSSLTIGETTSQNHLMLADGARIDSGGAILGAGAKASGNTATLSGEATSWNIATNLMVGGLGHSNRLSLAEGAGLTARNVHLGAGSLLNPTALFNSDGNNLRLEGTNTVLNAVSNVSVGTYGRSNRLEILDGARVESLVGRIGVERGSMFNETIVSGADAIWAVLGNLTVGVFTHSNRLTILDGGTVQAHDVRLGPGTFDNLPATGPNRANSVVVSGANSLLTNSGNFIIGEFGWWNSLEILDGAQVNSGNSSLIGLNLGPGNSASVIGPGSRWNNASGVAVGSYGDQSRLLVARGGYVGNTWGAIGAWGRHVGPEGCLWLSGSNTVIITDPGSLWENRGELVVGRESRFNSLIVSNSGMVLATNCLIGAVSGTLPGATCPPIPDANRIVIEGGCLVVTNDNESAVLEPRFGTLALHSGLVAADRLIRTNGDLSRLELNGGILRIGGGRIRNGSPLTVGDGLHGAELQLTPAVPNQGQLNFDFSAGVVIQSNAVLLGEGSVAGPITNRGTISPGNRRSGALGLGQLVPGPGSVLHFDLAGTELGGTYDYLGSSFNLQLRGRLRVSLRDGFVPAPGDVFRIIGTLITGDFDNVPLGGRLKTTDNLGSFVVATNGSFLVLRDYQSTDLDGDAIEDAWATTHFGHSPLSPAEKLADADADGASNYDEFRAGTDPNDPASALKLSIAYANGAATLSFPCVDGKEYRKWSSNDLETWSEVADPTFAYPAPGRCEWTDDGKETGGLGARARFYRVTVD